jgi:hypothetical protein
MIIFVILHTVKANFMATVCTHQIVTQFLASKTAFRLFSEHDILRGNYY